MKSLSRFLLMAVIVVIAGASTGCLFSALRNTSASEKDLKDHWYTYASPQPFSDAKLGLVLGRVGLMADGVQGCTFKIQRAEGTGWAAVEQTLEYRSSVYRGIILGHSFTTNTKKTFDVYAGNAPKGRREAVSSILGAGSMVGSVLTGDSDYTLNVRALQTFMAPGWFLLRLPPGRYRLAELAYEWYDTTASRSGNRTVTTVKTTWNSRGVGPEFEVKAGVVGYIGEHIYGGEAGEAKSTKDLGRAKRNLLRGLRRLPSQGGTAWPIEELPGVKG